MSKQTEYQVTFSYDLSQTGKVNYDTYLIRSIEKIGGNLVSKDEDDFGSKDLIMSVNSDLTTLQKTIKEVFHGLENKHVKLSVSAQKVQHAVNIDMQNINDFASFEALVSNWGSEKMGYFEVNGGSANLVLPNKYLADEFIKNILPQSTIFTTDGKTPVAFADLLREPVINSDNYNNKKRSSLSI